MGCLLERCEPMILRACRRIVRSEELARDLAQEAMLQAFLSLDRLRSNASVRSWLYGITLNVCRSYLRQQAQAAYSLEAMLGGMVFEALPFGAEAAAPQAVVEEHELRRSLFAAVQALPPAERQATQLFYYEQRSVQEIANALDISAVAVKGRLYKSRRRLRAALAELYPERANTVVRDERSKGMIQVVIADVVTQERKIEGIDRPLLLHVVALFDNAGRRMLPIWVGPQEGQAIAMGMRRYAVPRPMTYEFAARILEAAGATIEEVRVESLREETFFAVTKIRSAQGTNEVDTRPSDALALAVRTGCPIYVAPEVMEKAGIPIPGDVAVPTGKGMDQLLQGFEEVRKQYMTTARPTQTPEAQECSRQELISAVFGTS